MKKYNIFLSILVVYILLNMFLYPSLYMQMTFDGISAWTFNVLPSVLPFMFFTKVLAITGFTEKIGYVFSRPCKKLFKTPPSSAYVFFMSIISGYPVGAKITADLFESGKISRNDALKMTSFCSTSGPMFIIGAVGTGMLGNTTWGYIIFISHVLGALFNGLLYRNLKTKEIYENNTSLIGPKQDLSAMIYDSVISILSIGAIIAIFFVVITSLSPIFDLFSPQISSVLKGIIEITKGCIDISHLSGILFKITACTFVISFGGISTILQSLTMLDKLRMPIKLFVLQKITHAIFATITSLPLCLILI